jgi:heme a synthase
MSPAPLPITPPRGDRTIIVWLVACCVMLVVMIALGGLTRLTDSGLSITEWRPVTGAIPPLSQAAWQAEFDRYRAIPEYLEVNRGMTLDQFKVIYWWEYTHRLWGRLIGIVFALPFAWLWWRGRLTPALAVRLGIILVLGAAQGALGWYMVASGLVDRVDVSQYRLAAHMGLAVIIYAALVWVLLDIVRPPDRDAPAPWLPAMAGGFVALVFATMLAGAFVAGLDAGMAYNTFPLMDGAVVPASYNALAPWWLNLFENHATVQFNHRALGMSVLAAAIGMWVWARRHMPSARTRVWLAAAAVLSVTQACLGIATLLLAVPIALAALHQWCAIALLTAGLGLWHELRGSGSLSPSAAVPSATRQS